MDTIQSFTYGTVVEDEFLNDFQTAAAHVGSTNGHVVSGLCAQSLNGADIVVDAVTGFSIGSTGKWTNKATSTTYTPGSLSSATWYYLYGYIDGGNFTLTHSTTAPDAALVVKSDDSDKRFITAFRTYPASASVVPFQMRHRELRWMWSKISGGFNGIGGGGVPFSDLISVGSTGSADVSLAIWVPNFAKNVILHTRFAGGGSSVWKLKPTGHADYYISSQGTLHEFHTQLPFELVSSVPKITYDVSIAGGNIFIANALGFNW